MNYSGVQIRYSFLYLLTVLHFSDFLVNKTAESPYDIKAMQSTIDRIRDNYPPDTRNEYLEYKSLIVPTAKYLLKYNRCIFHSVSFIYQGRAWLLTAVSGTGKSTQYMNWTRLFPDEIQMISGDMPILELSDDQGILVHPSPWNGKENIHNPLSAPLGGIVYLEQGHINQIKELSAHEGVIPVLRQFVKYGDDETEINTLMSIIRNMFENYPVMKMINRGDDDSTRLLRNEIKRYTGAAYETICS